MNNEWLFRKVEICDYFDFFSEDSQIILNVERSRGMRRRNAFNGLRWVYWRGDEEWKKKERGRGVFSSSLLKNGGLFVKYGKEECFICGSI